MMKSDQLYMADLRLRELKHRFEICLQPMCKDYHLGYGDGSDSLLRGFEVINLTENHKQGKDKTYAELLIRVRVGEQTEEDMNLLTSIRKKNHPDLKGALYIACKREVVNGHNEKCLNGLQGKLYEINAKHLTKLKQNFKLYLKKRWNCCRYTVSGLIESEDWS